MSFVIIYHLQCLLHMKPFQEEVVGLEVVRSTQEAYTDNRKPAAAAGVRMTSAVATRRAMVARKTSAVVVEKVVRTAAEVFVETAWD